MNDLQLTAGTLLWGIFLIATLLILGNGVLPLLKSLTGLVEEKRAMAKKGLESIDAYFADNAGGLAPTMIRETMERLDFKPTDPALIGLADSQLLAQILALMNKVAPETPERISANELAAIANDITGVLKSATDQVKGNTKFPMEPPSAAG